MALNTIDWSKVKIHCSSLGCLFTEPREKAAKDKGELSVTAQKDLIKIYSEVKWGIVTDFQTKQMQKGNLAEQDSVTLLSRVDKKLYVTNKVRKENAFITGFADIDFEDIVIDTKTSWDDQTFLPKIIEATDKSYNYQLQGYMWLYEKDRAKLSYCLVDTPEMIIKNELRRLLWSMDVVSEEDEDYKIAAAQLMRKMIYNHIPPQERVISLSVDRDDEIISKIPAKVEQARKWLADFEVKHLAAFKPKPLLKITAA